MQKIYLVPQKPTTFDNFRRNSGFASDARRKEREMKRNRKMMMVLSGISVCFAVSWLPLQIFLIVTEHYNVFQVRLQPSLLSILEIVIYPVGHNSMDKALHLHTGGWGSKFDISELYSAHILSGTSAMCTLS